jgi:hypothetical protein
VVQRRLALADSQFARLREVDCTYASRRGALDIEETQLRMRLTRALRATPAPDDAVVDRVLHRLTIGIAQDELELARGEQRDLAALLTPVQRAEFMALREQALDRLQAVAPVPDVAAAGAPLAGAAAGAAAGGGGRAALRWPALLGCSDAGPTR